MDGTWYAVRALADLATVIYLTKVKNDLTFKSLKPLSAVEYFWVKIPLESDYLEEIDSSLISLLKFDVYRLPRTELLLQKYRISTTPALVNEYFEHQEKMK